MIEACTGGGGKLMRFERAKWSEVRRRQITNKQREVVGAEQA